eukprot:2874759-Rhodomonas_salina.1
MADRKSQQCTYLTSITPTLDASITRATSSLQTLRSSSAYTEMDSITRAHPAGGATLPLQNHPPSTHP